MVCGMYGDSGPILFCFLSAQYMYIVQAGREPLITSPFMTDFDAVDHITCLPISFKLTAHKTQ